MEESRGMEGEDFSIIAVSVWQFCNVKVGQTNLEILQKSVATAGVCTLETSCPRMSYNIMKC